MKTLAVIAGNFQEYTDHVTRDLIPVLEGYYDIKFRPSKNSTDFEAKDRFRVFYLKEPHQLKGLGDYQLVKCGQFFENPYLNEIEKVYAQEVKRRQEK